MPYLKKYYKPVVRIHSWQPKNLNLKPFDMRLELNQSALTTQMLGKKINMWVVLLPS